MFSQVHAYVSHRERERERKEWMKETEIRRALGDDVAPAASPPRWTTAARGLFARLASKRSSQPVSADGLGRQTELGSQGAA